jgi:hypothetical protein
MTRFWESRCLKSMDTPIEHHGQQRPSQSPGETQSVCAFGALLGLTGMTPEQSPIRTSSRQHHRRLAVRSFAVGNSGRAVFGLLVGIAGSRGAPDSLYLPIPVTFLLCLLCCVQAGREPRSSAHD